MISFSTSLQGLGTAQCQLNFAAKRIAQNPAEATDPKNALDINEAQNQFAANLDALKVDDEMTRTTLNLLA